MSLPVKKNSWIICLVIGAVFCSILPARTFTNHQGRQIEALVLKIHESSVDLRVEGDKKVQTVPFSKLSQADVDFLQAAAKEESRKSDSSAKNKQTRAKRTGRGSSTQSLMKEYGLKENFTDPWPVLVSTNINIEIDIITESKEEGVFVYHSPNYEFVSDVRLSKNVVNKFSVMFEATREYFRLLPISSMKAHVPGGQYRNKILLFENYDSYIKNGGLPGSAGVFIGSQGVVLVPLTSLGVKKVGSGYMFDRDKSNKTLIHEIIHQLTDPEYYAPGARGWFSEGLADYCATTPYRSGKFMVRTNVSAVKAYATGYGKDGRGGRAMGEKFDAPSLQLFMTMSYEDFKKDGNFNYGFGMLLTYYFCQMEDDRSNLTAFLKALKDGKQGEESLEVLLNGRSYQELEEQVAKKWRSKGVKITFPESD